MLKRFYTAVVHRRRAVLAAFVLAAVLSVFASRAVQVLLNGVDVTKLNKQELRALRQKMQIVFQDPYSSLDGRKSVFESIGEPLVIQKVCKSKKEYEERVYELMETVGLAERLVNAYPHELDGGPPPARWHSKGACAQSGISCAG